MGWKLFCLPLPLEEQWQRTMAWPDGSRVSARTVLGLSVRQALRVLEVRFISSHKHHFMEVSIPSGAVTGICLAVNLLLTCRSWKGFRFLRLL